MDQNLNVKVSGHVLIKDKDTNEILVDKNNAIHPQNIARVIAKGLAHEPNSWVLKMGLGNGGTNIDAGLTLHYLTPNTAGLATLYNQTYEEIIDDVDVSCPATNSCISAASPTPAITSIVTCTLELDAGQPAGQAADDTTTTDFNPATGGAPYVFDELALFAPGDVTDPINPLDPLATERQKLLTHLVFSPVEKTASRSILIVYTLTVSVS